MTKIQKEFALSQSRRLIVRKYWEHPHLEQLFAARKIYNVVKEIVRIKIGIMCIPDTNVCNVNGHTVYYSSTVPTHRQHRNGVAVLLNEKLQKSVWNFIAYLEQIIIVQLNCKPKNVNIVHVYAPTADKQNEEVKNLYR